MKILVTGGLGFIGSHLVTRLLQEGHWVICLDNGSTGRQLNVQAHLDNPAFQFIWHDVADPLPPALEEAGIQQIYHLACPASPPHYQADPIRTIRTSVWGTYHLLQLAQKTGARFLLASTSEVYGDPQVHPQPEDYWGHVNPIGPRACYDESKRLAETLTFDWQRQYQTEIRVARIFNTYGPAMREDDGRVMSNFIVQALRGDPLTVYGDGSQTRSFCYISDLVEGLIRLMNSPYPGPFNLGNPEEFTILELAQQVLALTGSPSPIVYRPLPTDDPRQRQPDIGKARALLGWEPRIPLQVGLQQTIPYFRQRLGLD